MASSVGSALKKQIETHAGVIALGLSIKDNIYPKKLPQNKKPPAITYALLADVPYDTIDGMAGLYRAVIEYKIYSTTMRLAEQIEDAIRLAIQGYRGEELNVTICGVHHLHVTDDFEDEINEYNLISRFAVFYRRENPDHEDDS